MPETTKAPSVVSSREIVEQCLQFVQRNGGRPCQVYQTPQTDRRAAPRMFFTHQLRYSTDSTLPGGHTKPAQVLDISLGGVGLWCFEPLGDGAVIHICLPVLDGKNAWVKGKVVYCRPEGEHFRTGIAFILD